MSERTLQDIENDHWKLLGWVHDHREELGAFKTLELNSLLTFVKYSEEAKLAGEEVDFEFIRKRMKEYGIKVPEIRHLPVPKPDRTYRL
jgi:hypothetical protein